MAANTIFIDINKWIIDINNSAANVLNAKTGCSLPPCDRVILLSDCSLLLRVGNYKLLNKIIVFINVFTHFLHFLDSISSQGILVLVFLYAAEFYWSWSS